MKSGLRFLQFFSTAIGLYLLATGASGAVLKSVQTGTRTMGATPATVNFAPAVVSSNTFVICQADTGGVTSIPNARATCDLNALGTQLTIQTSAADGTALPNTLTVRWYVAEFLSGVSVQRGIANIAAGTTIPAAIVLPTAVNLASSFVLITERMIEPTLQTIDEQWTVRAQLTAAGANLQLTRNAGGTIVNVAWQVVQIDSAAVQSGTATILRAALTATAPLAPSVDINHTFLVFSRSAGSATGGDERLYQVTGRITANQITFTRALQNNLVTTQVDIVWYAVRMTDGTTVQNNVCGPPPSFAAGTAIMPNTPAGCLTIPNPIATNRTIALLSTMGDAASGTGVGDLDDTSWRSTIAPAGNAIALNRSGAGSMSTNATVAWQVVQFNTTTNTIDRVEVVP